MGKIYSFKLVGVGAALIMTFAMGCSSAQKHSEAPATPPQPQSAPQAAVNQAPGIQAPATPPEAMTSTPTPPTPEQGAEKSGLGLGGPSYSRGEANIAVKKRITRTVIMQNQLPTVKICEQRADVNRMDAEDFMAVGFTQQETQQILQSRKQKGGFQSLSDMASVAGINTSLVRELGPELVFTRGSNQQAGESGAGW